MDRNQGVHYDNYNLHVALRKESVDRNSVKDLNAHLYYQSLSARRAWIEILICFGSLAGPSGVALRKESEDRNRYAISFSA